MRGSEQATAHAATPRRALGSSREYGVLTGSTAQVRAVDFHPAHFFSRRTGSYTADFEVNQDFQPDTL